MAAQIPCRTGRNIGSANCVPNTIETVWLRSDFEAKLLRAEKLLASLEKQVADAEAELDRLESKNKK